MEKILKIEDFENSKIPGTESYENFEGFRITTDEQEIWIAIDNGISCCESWGHFSTNDSIDEFIGATLKDIRLVDTSLNLKMIEKKFEYGFDGGGIIFVNLETDKGTLQFAVYNEHNGYYGHSVVIKSKQLNESTGL